VSNFLCQYDYDAKHFIALGVAKSKVKITGSIKFDLSVTDEQHIASAQFRSVLGKNRPIWIAASSHKGEETELLKAHRKLLKSHSNALMILVPRHPEQFNFAYETSCAMGFSTARRSNRGVVELNTQVYLGDTMGEMLLLLGAADICFMGGSLLGDKVGGHNSLEPAAFSIPVLNGSSYYNFKEITEQLIDRGGLKVCKNSDEIAHNLALLMEDEEYRQSMGELAFSVLMDNRGALEKTIAELAKTYR
jgi:3-deoxy-D-manno-octulosonic-acid transferase